MSEELTQQLPNDLLRQILARLDSMESRFDSRLNSIETRLDSMDARLTALEDKVERRLQETRPIWEAVLEQLKEVNARLDRTETRLDRIEKELVAMRRWARHTFAAMGQESRHLQERAENHEARRTS